MYEVVVGTAFLNINFEFNAKFLTVRCKVLILIWYAPLLALFVSSNALNDPISISEPSFYVVLKIINERMSYSKHIANTRA